MYDPSSPQDGAYQIEILRSRQDLLKWREFWLQSGPSRDAHPDFFAMIIDVTANVIAPYVLVLLRGGSPVAVLVARIDRSRVRSDSDIGRCFRCRCALCSSFTAAFLAPSARRRPTRWSTAC
jgi:hypothetical protein